MEAQRASLSHQPAPPYTSPSQTHASEESEPQAEPPDRHQNEQNQDQPLPNGVMPALAGTLPPSTTHGSATETESSAPDRPAVETAAPASTETAGQTVSTRVVEVVQTPSVDAPVVDGEPDTMDTDTAVNGGQAPADSQTQPQDENMPVNSSTTDQSHPRENEEPSEESSPSTASDGSTDSSESTERTGEDYEEDDENDEPAYWAEFKEDTSVAEGDELKEIESGDADHSAHECKSQLLYFSASIPLTKPILARRLH